jgi:hypothetical protein
LSDETLSTARRTITSIVGVGLLAITVGAIAIRYVPIPSHSTLYAVIASPHRFPAGLIAFLIFVRGRRSTLAALAGLLDGTE